MGKMKQIKKILLIISVVVISIITFDQVSAVNTEIEKNVNTENAQVIKVAEVNYSSIIDSGKNFVKRNDKEVNDYANMFVGIGQILVGVGVTIIFISFAIMGIKWIVASPDQKAKLKEQLIGLVIASIVIFGAVGIWEIAKRIGYEVEDSIANTNDRPNIVTIASKN